MPPALLLIDIQNDYFPGGAMELAGSCAAGEQAARLLAHFRANRQPVLHVRHTTLRPGATFLRPGTPGAELHPYVAPLAGEPVFDKHVPNSFRDTGLLAHLREQRIDQLVIAGMMTHMCVDTTVRAAFDLSFTCSVAADACATRDLTFAGTTCAAAQVQVAYLAALHGLFARVLAVGELLIAP